MAANVHHERTVRVELLDDPDGRDADGADEQRHLLVDHHVDERLQLAAGVVLVRLARVAADLRDGQVHAEVAALVDEVGLDAVMAAPSVNEDGSVITGER